MKYLAIDTSGDLVVIAVNGEKTVVKYLEGCTAQHSLTLMPYVEKSLDESGLELDSVDFFAVVTGPGSFTGIRIGVSTVKALCLASGKKALGLTAFDCLAYDDNVPEKAFCVIDASHGNYYCAAYDGKKLSMAPCFLTEAQVREKSAGYTIVASKEVPFDGAVTASIPNGLKNAADRLGGAAGDYETVLPLYVKRSQAEEESC